MNANIGTSDRLTHPRSPSHAPSAFVAAVREGVTLPHDALSGVAALPPRFQGPNPNESVAQLLLPHLGSLTHNHELAPPPPVGESDTAGYRGPFAPLGSVFASVPLPSSLLPGSHLEDFSLFPSHTRRLPRDVLSIDTKTAPLERSLYSTIALQTKAERAEALLLESVVLEQMLHKEQQELLHASQLQSLIQAICPAYLDVPGSCLQQTGLSPSALVLLALQQNLANSVSTQRKENKALDEGRPSSLDSGRVNILDNMGAWKTRLQELIDFQKCNGHCRVPINNPPNPALGYWVSSQRQETKEFGEGRPSSVDKEKVKLLDDVGFVWKVDEKKEAGEDAQHNHGETRRNQLIEFNDERNRDNGLVPEEFRPYPAPELRVSRESSHQRQLDDGCPMRLDERNVMFPEERRSILNNMEPSGNQIETNNREKISQHDHWESCLKDLVEFKRAHGHCQVPLVYPPHPALGSWVSAQQKEKEALDAGRESRLNTEKVKILQDLGVVLETAPRGLKRKIGEPNQSDVVHLEESAARLSPQHHRDHAQAPLRIRASFANSRRGRRRRGLRAS